MSPEIQKLTELIQIVIENQQKQDEALAELRRESADTRTSFAAKSRQLKHAWYT